MGENNATGLRNRQTTHKITSRIGTRKQKSELNLH